MIGKACLRCGRRVPDGQPCPSCQGQRYQLPSSCIECGARATSGPYCEEHKPKPKESSRASYRKGYRDPAYYRERQAALNRARGACELCGAIGKLEVDHIVPLRDGGQNRRENLQAVCVPCHQLKTRADRRRRGRPARGR